MLNHPWRQRSDEELVGACLRGDAAAWEALIARYQRLVYGIALRAGLPPADADDVFQNVSLKICLHLDSLRDHAALTGWVGAVTRRECLRRHRRRAGEPETTPLDDARDVPGGEPPADEALLREERAHEVRRGLEELPPACQRLLGLLYGSEEPPPYADVAVRLGVPLGSIGPTRARCLKRLRKKMEEQQEA